MERAETSCACGAREMRNIVRIFIRRAVSLSGGQVAMRNGDSALTFHRVVSGPQSAALAIAGKP